MVSRSGWPPVLMPGSTGLTAAVPVRGAATPPGGPGQASGCGCARAVSFSTTLVLADSGSSYHCQTLPSSSASRSRLHTATVWFITARGLSSSCDPRSSCGSDANWQGARLVILMAISYPGQTISHWNGRPMSSADHAARPPLPRHSPERSSDKRRGGVRQRGLHCARTKVVQCVGRAHRRLLSSQGGWRGASGCRASTAVASAPGTSPDAAVPAGRRGGDECSE
jgi:hypothetical protein